MGAVPFSRHIIMYVCSLRISSNKALPFFLLTTCIASTSFANNHKTNLSRKIWSTIRVRSIVLGPSVFFTSSLCSLFAGRKHRFWHLYFWFTLRHRSVLRTWVNNSINSFPKISSFFRARFGPYAFQSGSRRQKDLWRYTLHWRNNSYTFGQKIIDYGDVSANTILLAL